MSSIQSNFTQLQSLNKTHLVLDNKFHQNNGKKNCFGIQKYMGFRHPNVSQILKLC